MSCPQCMRGGSLPLLLQHTGQQCRARAHSPHQPSPLHRLVHCAASRHCCTVRPFSLIVDTCPALCRATPLAVGLPRRPCSMWRTAVMVRATQRAVLFNVFTRFEREVRPRTRVVRYKQWTHELACFATALTQCRHARDWLQGCPRRSSACRY